MTYRPAIETAAAAHGLDPDLVAALVEQESSNDSDAWNPEPRYRYFWNVRSNQPFRSVKAEEVAAKFPPHDFPALAGDDQEWWGQQASWGLCQIMGAVARELGFKGKYLPKLCSDPALNLALGCEHLAHQMAWARGLYVGLASGEQAAITRSGLAAYNGGRSMNSPNGPLRNREYADKVLVRYHRIKGET